MSLQQTQLPIETSIEVSGAVNAGAVVAGRYRVMSSVGKGCFAQVFASYDLRDHKRVALKVLGQGFATDAKAEHSVLAAIQKHDPAGKSGCVALIESLQHRGNFVFVLPLKGPSLRSKKFPLARMDVVDLAVDVAVSLMFLHGTVRAVHTDLKPENIVTELSSATGRKWSICDFGSSSIVRAGENDSDLITTRPYRAPEVIRGDAWSFPADMWSLGCILYEVYTGNTLFQAVNDRDHLREISYKLDVEPFVIANEGPIDVSALRTLGVPTLREQLALQDPTFYALLLKLLCVDPHARARPEVVLTHSFTRPQQEKEIQFDLQSRSSSSAASLAPRVVRKRLRGQ